MKTKFKIEDVVGVRLNFVDKESWLATRTKKKEIKCENCGMLHIDCAGAIAFVSFKTRVNGHMCEMCGREYISLGAIDYSAKVDKKKDIIQMINDMKKYDTCRYRYHGLESKSINELEEILNKCNSAKAEKDRIDTITFTGEEKFMDDYLLEQYGVIHHHNDLKCVEQIEPYFEDVGREYFDCGQGYYQEMAELIVKIGLKFYKVVIEAEVFSSKQDYGDSLYWVEDITNVKYHEIDKPIKRERFTEWFDLLNAIHIRELIHYIDNAKWNPAFIPDNIYMDVGWYNLVVKDLAEHWIIERMSKDE